MTTIFDVARRAGVSYGTVSRVLNDNPHVRPETRERIQQAMRELGYVTNKQARSLAGASSEMIGLIVPDLGTGYIAEIMRGIDKELSLTSLDLILYTTRQSTQKESSYIANLASGMVDGLLLVLPSSTVESIAGLIQRDFPFVMIDHQGIGENSAAVGATNWQGAFSATEYLVKLGHRRIGFITGSMDMGCSVARLDGYLAALHAYHIHDCTELIFEGSFQQADGIAGASVFLNLKEPPTAIFTSNDVMAFGVMDAVRSRGLRIPQDISIVGFDDIPQAALTHPALTTVNQPLEKMGRVATQMLLDMLRHEDRKVKRIELPTELIIRESCQSLEPD